MVADSPFVAGSHEAAARFHPSESLVGRQQHRVREHLLLDLEFPEAEPSVYLLPAAVVFERPLLRIRLEFLIEVSYRQHPRAARRKQ